MLALATGPHCKCKQEQMEQKSVAASRQRRFRLLGPLLLFCFGSFSMSWSRISAFRRATGASSTDISRYANSSDISSDNDSSHGEAQSTNEGDNATLSAKRKISMIVELKGEMANHLSLVARAYAIKRSIEQHLLASKGRAVEIQLIGQHQDHEKWIGVRDNLQSCFSHFFASFDFEGGRWDSEQYTVRSAQQKAWLQRHDILTNTGLLHVDRRDCRDGNQCWRQAADHLITLLEEQENNPADESIQEDSNAPSDHETALSLPFLTSTRLSGADEFTEEYYNKLRALFKFDDEKCCKELPADDEVAFHFRNFGEHLWDKGFHEMGPNQTASELMNDFPMGSKITMVMRHSEDTEKVESFRQALSARGLSLRFVEGQSSTEDFCFLKKARKELIGTRISTFAL